MNFKSFVFLILLSCLLHANSYKFDLMDDIFDLDLEQLKNMQINTASKSLQNLDKTPAKIIIITKEQIEQRGYKSLDNLLNDLPGVQILRYADSGIINQIGIRGIMGNNYFKILQDGIEIDQTDGEIMSVSMQYPLFGVERVEILYGAASVIYGADAMSGVINIITSSKPNGQAGIWTGIDGYRYLYATQALKINDGILSYRTHIHKDQDYNFDKEYPDNYYGNSSYEFQPHETKSASIKYEKDGLDMGLNYRYSSESTLISMNGINSQANRYNFDKNANLNIEQINTFTRYKTDLISDIKSTTTLSYSSTELLDDSYFINRYTDFKKGYKYSKSQKYSIEESLNKELNNHNITFGTSIDWYESTPMTYDLRSSNDRNPTFYGTNIIAPIYNKKWHNIAFYLQDQITLNENFQLSLAGRYDENSAYDSTFNPRIALIHSNDFITQKWIYSQAFLAPSNYNKYKIYGFNFKQDSSGVYTSDGGRVPNDDLQPEKSKTYEYNLDFLLNRNHSMSFSLYHTTIDDVILIETPLNDGDYFNNGTFIKNPKGAENAANSEIYGAEVSYFARSYFSGYDIDYWINYSYIQGEIHYLYDYDLPFLSSHILKAGTTLNLKNFTVSPSITWTSPIQVAPYDDKDRNGDITDKKVDGYFIANIYSSYNFTKTQKLALKISNIFDKHYYGTRYNSSDKYLSPQDTRMINLAYIINF